MTNPLILGVMNGLKPDKRQTVSEWAESNRILTTESSSEAGKYRVARTPYAREIMDSCSPMSGISEVKVMKGTQVAMCLPLDLDVPTLRGVVKMKDLKVGDVVFDENGKTCNVTTKTPIYYNEKCFKLYFSDGSTVVTNDKHRWKVNRHIGSTFKRYETIKTTTSSMMKDFKQVNRNRYTISVTKPLLLATKKLPLDPYFLGCWLGDGSVNSNVITTHKDDIEHMCNKFTKADIPHKVIHYRQGDCKVIRFGVGKGNTCRRGHNKKSMYHQYGKPRGKILNNAIVPNLLKDMGVTNCKHIPREYFISSDSQRLELLRGLMDTDGCISHPSKCTFVSIYKVLVEDVMELLCSLGYKPTIRKIKLTSNKLVKHKIGDTAYKIYFTAYSERPPASLVRKNKGLISSNEGRVSEVYRRRITNIERVESEPVQCITVDSTSKLFLVTRSYIPTHNSTVGDNVVLAYLDLYPCPILYIVPTETLANGTSVRRIAPAIKAIPHLRSKIIGGKSKDDVGNVMTKNVAGGGLTLGWSNSTASFRSFSARVVILDDVDGFGEFGEGSVMALGKARADAFSNKIIFINSTPTIKGDSNIETEYEDSDQREYFMPCPDCKELIRFTWGNFEFTHSNYTLTSDVTYGCPKCGSLIPEYKKTWMMKEGNGAKWIPQNKGHIHRGYLIPSFLAPFGWLSWNEIGREFLKASKSLKRGDSRLMQTWVNTREARPFMRQLSGVEITNKEERTRHYGAEVPNEVLLITAGVDTQDDRFEVMVVGFGADNQIYVIGYKVISGDPQYEATQRALDEYLIHKSFTRVDGFKMKIQGACVDSGGHRTKAIYAYVKHRLPNKIFAIKGSSRPHAPIVNKQLWQNRAKDNLFIIGTVAIKDDFYARLAINEVGYNYVHFPKIDVIDDKFFKGLTSEKRDSKGVYIKVRTRNEQIDTMVYAIACVSILNIDVSKLEEPILYIRQETKLKVNKNPKNYNSNRGSWLDEY